MFFWIRSIFFLPEQLSAGTNRVAFAIIFGFCFGETCQMKWNRRRIYPANKNACTDWRQQICWVVDVGCCLWLPRKPSSFPLPFQCPIECEWNKFSLSYHFLQRKFARISLVSRLHDRRSIAHLKNEWMTPALNITKSLCIFVESVNLIGHPITYVSETLEIDHFQKYLSHKG